MPLPASVQFASHLEWFPKPYCFYKVPEHALYCKGTSSSIDMCNCRRVVAFLYSMPVISDGTHNTLCT
jgi:hypothetical protein